MKQAEKQKSPFPSEEKKKKRQIYLKSPQATEIDMPFIS